MTNSPSDEYLVDIQFTGGRIPTLFDAMSDAKSGNITFTKDNLTVTAEDYENLNKENVRCYMSFQLDKKESDHFHVQEDVERGLDVQTIFRKLNLRGIRNQKKSFTTIRFIIAKDAPNKLRIRQWRNDNPTVGEFSVTLRVDDSGIDMQDTYYRDGELGPVIISSALLKIQFLSLSALDEKFCTIRVEPTKLCFIGEGNGVKSSVRDTHRFTIDVKQAEEAEKISHCEVQQATFEVAQLKTVTKHDSVAEHASLYLQNGKPLIIEYRFISSKMEKERESEKKKKGSDHKIYPEEEYVGNLKYIILQAEVSNKVSDEDAEVDHKRKREDDSDDDF